MSVQIIHKGQHLLKHKAQDVGYVNATSPADNNVKLALDNIYASLGTILSWQAPVANRAALPLTGNTVNDARVVQDDGDTKPAIYVCIATAGDVDAQWQKIADVDWGNSAFQNIVFIDNTDSPYTAGTSDETIILVDTSSGAVTVTLPAATDNANRIFIIKKISSDSNQITLDPNASETIDGFTTIVFAGQYTSYTLNCDGSNWNIT